MTMAAINGQHVDQDEAGMAAGLAEPEVDRGLQLAREAALQLAQGVLLPLVSTMTGDNVSQRLSMMSQLSSHLAKITMNLGRPEVFLDRRAGGSYISKYDRETAGVTAIKEMVSAVGNANKAPLERRLEALTGALRDAKEAGAMELHDKILVQANTVIDALAGQPVMDPPVKEIETGGRALGEIADAMEGGFGKAVAYSDPMMPEDIDSMIEDAEEEGTLSVGYAGMVA